MIILSWVEVGSDLGELKQIGGGEGSSFPCELPDYLGRKLALYIHDYLID